MPKQLRAILTRADALEGLGFIREAREMRASVAAEWKALSQ